MTISSDHPVLKLVAELRQNVSQLKERYPDRHFTLDGHLVGSIGEVLAAETYGLELLPASSPTHDALAPDGCAVQIKLTQRTGVGLSSEPDHLLVHKLHDDGRYEEVYNGPGGPVWQWCGPRIQKNGQARISLTRLKALMAANDPATRIPPLDEGSARTTRSHR